MAGRSVDTGKGPDLDLLSCSPEDIHVSDTDGYLSISTGPRGMYRYPFTVRTAVTVSMVFGACGAAFATVPLSREQVLLAVLCSSVSAMLVTAYFCWLLVPVARMWPQQVVQRCWLAGVDAARPASDVRDALRSPVTRWAVRDVLAHLASGTLSPGEYAAALRRLDVLCAHAALDAVDEF